MSTYRESRGRRSKKVAKTKVREKHDKSGAGNPNDRTELVDIKELEKYC